MIIFVAVMTVCVAAFLGYVAYACADIFNSKKSGNGE